MIRCAGGLTVGISLILSGCGLSDSREVKLCEEGILAKLKAPSSYKRIKASQIYMSGPKEVWVDIEYDAANSYNALLRDTEICKYPATADKSVDWKEWEQRLAAPIENAATDPAAEIHDAAASVGEAAVRAAEGVASPDASAAKARAVADQVNVEASASAGEKRTYPYTTPDGVTITNAKDRENWIKYGTTQPGGGE